MLDLGLEKPIEIQKTDARGKALGEILGDWGSKWVSMTTWSSKVCPETYVGNRVRT